VTTAPPPRYQADLDLCGRIMLTHRLPPLLLSRALGLDPQVAAAVVAGAIDAVLLGDEGAERLTLFANVLTRLELRFAHDSRAVRRALDRPVDGLGGTTVAEAVAGDLPTLRMLRRALDDMAEAPTRWWRVGH
jgi:hypothetical protein